MTKEQFIVKLESMVVQFPNLLRLADILTQVKSINTEKDWDRWWKCYNSGIGNFTK